MQHTIRQAIRRRQLLEVVYKDCKRVVEPYALYLTKADKLILESRQIDGASNTPLPHWCPMPLAAMMSVALLEQSFQPHPEYNPNNSKYERALCRV